jgi:hypothetical protein
LERRDCSTGILRLRHSSAAAIHIRRGSEETISGRWNRNKLLQHSQLIPTVPASDYFFVANCAMAIPAEQLREAEEEFPSTLDRRWLKRKVNSSR